MAAVRIQVLPYSGPEKTEQVTRGRKQVKRYHAHTGEAPKERLSYWGTGIQDSLESYYESKNASR